MKTLITITRYMLLSLTVMVAAMGGGQSARAEMNFVKVNFRPAVAINMGEYGSSSKEAAESAKKMKKNYNASRIDLQQWSDNSINLAIYLKPKKRTKTDILLARTPKEEFIMRRADGRMLFDSNAVTNVETATVDGKLFYHGYNTNINRHYLETAEGKRVFTSDGSIALLDDGEEKIWFTMTGTSPTFYNFEGKTIFWINGSSTDIESTPAIPEGIKEVTVNGEKVQMYSPAYPKYFYAQTSDDYDHIHIALRDGTNVGLIDPNLESFFPEPGSGYILWCYDPDVSSYTSQRLTELGGEIVQLNEIVTTAGGQPLGLKGADTKAILSNVEDIAYCTDSHSVTYSDRNRGREANQGALFLRDSSLDIPPHFYEAGYRFNADTEKWEPWVRRKLFAKSEPYVPGMEETPVSYADDGERMVNEGKYFDALSNYYMKLPENHKFTTSELSLINRAGLGGGIDRLQWAHYQGLISNHPELEVGSHRIALEAINNNLHTATAGLATQLFDRAIASPANKEAADYAKTLKAGMEESKQSLIAWGDDIKARKERYIADYEAANRATTPRSSSFTRTLPVASEGAPAASATQGRNNATNAAMAAAVMGMVHRNISRAMGVIPRSNNGLSVTYTPGRSASASGSYSDSGSSTSPGSKVNTASKCSHCSGSGQCQTCKSHPGYATAGDTSHKCKACSGSARCYYCGGAGYRSM